jgi:hypothetical protein
VQPHRQADAKRCGALHVVSHQLAHVSACRHVAILPMGLRIRGTREQAMRYSQPARLQHSHASGRRTSHASDRVRRTGFPRQAAARR